MAYTPNYSDIRVQNRIIHALGFCIAVLDPVKPRQWSTRYIDQYFGQAQTPLSKYIRQHLLICQDHSYTVGANHCKSYLSNSVGIEYIKNRLAGVITPEPAPSTPTRHTHDVMPRHDRTVVARFVEREYGAELRSGVFDYSEKHYRLWHNLQNVRSQYRKPILGEYGYTHHYDIVCSAPTLLSQLSRQLGNDIWMGGLDYYLLNRTDVRTLLATDLESDIKTVKVLINSLFCGAKVSVHPESSMFQLLDSDPARIEYIRQHPYITELRSDIKTMWEYITPEIPRRRDQITNRLKPVTSSDKWRVYFRTECEVMTLIRRYLSQQQIRFFNEHDGWCSDKPVDLAELTEWIFSLTGYQLRFDYVQIQ